MTILSTSLPPLGSLLLLAAVQTAADPDPITVAGRDSRSEARERTAARRYAAGRAMDRARRARLAPSSPIVIECPEADRHERCEWIPTWKLDLHPRGYGLRTRGILARCQTMIGVGR